MPGRKRAAGVGYEAIADALRERIESGELPPGAKVPSENDVMTEFGAGRDTVTKALRRLRDEGLTTATQGAATRVREFKPIRRPANRRLSQEVWGAGVSMWAIDVQDKTPTVADAKVERIEATVRVAEALGIRRGEAVVRRSRRYLIDGKPVLKSDSYLPAEIADGTAIAEIETGDGGIYARLGELGFGPARFKEELRIRMPNRQEKAWLQLGPGTPVVIIVRVAVTAEGRVVEVNEMVLDASAYILDYVIDA
ncbi:GntR family transcriptional regulator [Streptomyces sp. RKAG293]|uniref:GntR family transcriptional regulator n=1 Tax=Streptomyces sp. RKAG293 TaxID=2893403 RepID=UPI0020347565|nr:GntR family transcriptional regulator [Streptomyces sp. RKAG293]MCM2424213.1 GntR family transcriptional regulator [Streptomyces sp. RKAG293]